MSEQIIPAWRIPKCAVCGEESPDRGSFRGLVHRWGPRDHAFEMAPCPEWDAQVARALAVNVKVQKGGSK